MKGSTFVWMAAIALLIALLMRKPVVTSNITYDPGKYLDVWV